MAGFSVADIDDVEGVKERLSKYTIRGGESDCWTWTGRTVNGRGMINIRSHGQHVGRYAYRVAYVIYVGPIPKDRPFACHTCDNRVCVNPGHIFTGTHDDNMDDMVEKGRQASGDKQGRRLHPESTPKGSRHGRSRLDETRVLRIRELSDQGMRQVDLAEMFGVSDTTIWKIQTRRLWTHI